MLALLCVILVTCITRLSIYIFPYNGPWEMAVRYCDDIGFLLDFHRDVVTSLYDIFFQDHNVLAVA